MITKIILPLKIEFTEPEVKIIMLCIWSFSQKQMAEITGLEIFQIKGIIRSLCGRLRGQNAGNMGFHAQLMGFRIDGTVDGEDIFNQPEKQKILDIDPSIQFKFPPRSGHPTKKAA